MHSRFFENKQGGTLLNLRIILSKIRIYHKTTSY